VVGPRLWEGAETDTDRTRTGTGAYRAHDNLIQADRGQSGEPTIIGAAPPDSMETQTVTLFCSLTCRAVRTASAYIAGNPSPAAQHAICPFPILRPRSAHVRMAIVERRSRSSSFSSGKPPKAKALATSMAQPATYYTACTYTRTAGGVVPGTYPLMSCQRTRTPSLSSADPIHRFPGSWSRVRTQSKLPLRP
jgi:hypothetical protein